MTLSAQIYTETDVQKCSETFSFAVGKGLSDKPIGEVISSVAMSFLGTDYLAHGIENEGEEQLVINLKGLDCTTFLENALVFSRLIKSGDTAFEAYMDELILIRYRDGIINRYPSRLHYFSDWIYDNEKKGIVKDITREMGGAAVKFNLNFMSSHPEYYTRLKAAPEFLSVIEAQEKEISGRQYFYIPKENVAAAEDNINEGDLIAFTTSVKGLDIGHAGIAIKNNGRVHLLHAPEPGEKVQVTKKPLAEYIRYVKKHTGIIVLRPLEP